MGELRKDYILDRWVLISTERSKRPIEFTKPNQETIENCSFCPGQEDQTTTEIGRIENGKSWKMRWFMNKYPAVKSDVVPKIETHNKYYTFSGAYGHHELLVETADHNTQLWDLSIDELEKVFRVYNKRIEELMLHPHIKFVDVFKNHGSKGGTTVQHSHTQIMAINHIPDLIRQKLKAMEEHQNCPYCEIIQSEKKSDRRCFENEHFIAFTPYASRYNYEIWVFPKNHIKNLSGIKEYKSLATIMKQILDKLKSINASYNYYLQYSPVDEFHFHIEITPRLSKWGGFEGSTDEIINTISPEQAAEFYRGDNEDSL